MSNALKTYQELSEMLRRAGLATNFSELHGGLCGSLCAGGLSASKAWTSEWLAESAAGDPGADIRESLEVLELRTWQALSRSAFSFEPLLPDDDEALETRVEALAAWCQGFLTGLGSVGGGALRRACANEQIEEIIRDFGEIGKAFVDGDADADRDGAGFELAELVEYVRAGTQIVFETLAPWRHSDAGDSIH